MNGKPDNSQIEQVPRGANGQLQPGARLNPSGRPRGSCNFGGFRAAMQIVADIANSAEFRAALQEQAEKHPFKYARTVLVPLAPANQRKELRAQIRAAEQAAFERARSAFSGVSETGAP